jgi:hypothetical protein
LPAIFSIKSVFSSSWLPLVLLMAAPTFGFSFGDFVTALKLIRDISFALRDVSGAATEYRLLLEELQHLEMILKQLQDMRMWSAQSQTNYNAICGMARTIEKPLIEFLNKIKKYDRRLGLSQGNTMKNVGRKLHWAFAMKEEIPQLRATITMKILSLSLLLTIPTKYVVADCRDDLQG